VQRTLLQQRILDVGRFFLFQPFAFLERQAVRPMRGPCCLQGAAGVAALAQREPDPVLDFLQIGRLADPRLSRGIAADRENPCEGFRSL
jgi:hypothetical protein